MIYKTRTSADDCSLIAFVRIIFGKFEFFQKDVTPYSYFDIKSLRNMDAVSTSPLRALDLLELEPGKCTSTSAPTMLCRRLLICKRNYIFHVRVEINLLTDSFKQLEYNI